MVLGNTVKECVSDGNDNLTYGVSLYLGTDTTSIDTRFVYRQPTTFLHTLKRWVNLR